MTQPRAKIYDASHDQILTGSEFKAELETGTPFGRPIHVDLSFLPTQDENDALEVAVSDVIASLSPQIADASSSAETAIAVLFPQAGSLRGHRSTSTLDIWANMAGALMGVLETTQAQTALIGYTTTSWKGGLSRAAWHENGRPKNPGRLCDLLHVVYSDFSDAWTTEARDTFDYGVRTGFLRENVDGEAIDFATAKLLETTAKRRIIVLFDKGHALDDSTCAANAAPYSNTLKTDNYLTCDRIAAIAVAKSKGIEFVTIRNFVRHEASPGTQVEDIAYSQADSDSDVRKAVTAVVGRCLA